MQSYIDRADKEGVPVLAKSTVEAVAPIIYDVTDPQHFLAKEEVFGPVLAIITVKSFDEAMLIANQTDYGLAASLFTSNIKQALRGARLKAGTVTVNSYGEGDVTTPLVAISSLDLAGVTMGWRRMTNSHKSRPFGLI